MIIVKEDPEIENQSIEEITNPNKRNEELNTVDSTSLVASTSTTIDKTLENNRKVSASGWASTSTVQRQKRHAMTATEYPKIKQSVSVAVKMPKTTTKSANANDRKQTEKRCDAVTVRVGQKMHPNSLLDVNTISNPIETINGQVSADYKQLRKIIGDTTTVQNNNGSGDPETIDLISNDENRQEDNKNSTENVVSQLQPKAQRQNWRAVNAKKASENLTKKTKSVEATDRKNRFECGFCEYSTHRKYHLSITLPHTPMNDRTNVNLVEKASIKSQYLTHFIILKSLY